ncbi:fumarylacetoacetate hydrolase family protein [Marinimicrobium alkaliphilum]|uniref:fumarylacetoacetate hydrolase family protein n=1 Tax=Marinimicrobium alkaliphilum TaxID=2202654 RepID=UPI000DB9E9A3|nr:fumarylacetoacetate hydrolase family protein [Marinimicrobium alkaliphilum]
MKLATYPNDTLDGELLVVSADLTCAVYASAIAPSLIDAVQHWEEVESALRSLYEQVNAGEAADTFAFDPERCLAPLPRSPQWLDGSAYLNHGHLMERAFNTPPIPEFDTVPVMYQGASDDFRGPRADITLPSEADGIDFEGEFGAIVDEVPMGADADEAHGRIRLLVQLNDWSLRALGPREMKSGFGFVQAKPSTSFAPVAVTPDELGADWCNGRVQLNLKVTRNGKRFGEPHGGEMNFSFGQLIAHAARTRRLSPGTIVGSGTVSNVDRNAGSACISERRVIEIIDQGEAKTAFMAFGEQVRMEAVSSDGRAPFGVIDQRILAPER